MDTIWRCIACDEGGAISRAKYICYTCNKKHLLCRQCYWRLGGSWDNWITVFGGSSRHCVVDHENCDCTRLQYALEARDCLFETVIEQLQQPLGPIGVTLKCGEFIAVLVAAAITGYISANDYVVIRYLLLTLFYVAISAFGGAVSNENISNKALCALLLIIVSAMTLTTQPQNAMLSLSTFIVAVFLAVQSCKIDVPAHRHIKYNKRSLKSIK